VFKFVKRENIWGWSREMGVFKYSLARVRENKPSKEKHNQAPAAHSYNPSYLGG
jgi:hypothetical protein